MNIQAGSVFINPEGRTVKIDDLLNGWVIYKIDGSTKTENEHPDKVRKMLESGGYVEATQLLSSFYLGTDPHGVGAKIFSSDGSYTAEITKKDARGIHVKFGSKSNSTIYIYEPKDFNFKQIFTAELISELNAKFVNNVFEVIGETSKSKPLHTGINEVKFTVAGSTINKDLLDKITKKYEDIHIYSIKRLTSINIQ